MSSPERDRLTRRRFLQAGLALPVPVVLAACRGATRAPEAGSPAATRAPATTGAAALPATPECTDGDEPLTPVNAEGPYFTPSSPERASLVEPGMPGSRLVLTGSVLTTRCEPAARALLDLWQADDAGEYDNEGYRLRGHQLADANGRYRFETIVPGVYPGRTRHIHIKVQAPGGPVLTTQLYFPGEAGNASDGLFRPELLLDVRDAGTRKHARFDFVVETG